MDSFVRKHQEKINGTHDNMLLRMDDWGRMQKLADRFTGLNWPRTPERYARYVHPLLKDLPRRKTKNS